MVISTFHPHYFNVTDLLFTCFGLCTCLYDGLDLWHSNMNETVMHLRFFLNASVVNRKISTKLEELKHFILNICVNALLHIQVRFIRQYII